MPQPSADASTSSTGDPGASAIENALSKSGFSGDAKKTKKLISSKAVCWIATEDEKNVNWVGEQTVDEIATVIANARGPSGPNYEYLFNLADAMRSFNIEDEHLYELEAQVKKLLLGDNVEV
jgi:cation transport regulator ChaC